MEALYSGQIRAATLDVMATEPLPSPHPFWQDRRITITPHIAAMTLRDETIAQVAEKLRTFEQNGKVSGVVDRKRGY